jgi:crossover junction endodeoxyribonuclease RuvC
VKASTTRILGLDPGLARVGYALVDARGASLRKIACDVITTPASIPTETRLLDIFHAVQEIISTYRPDVAAVEQFFFIKNPLTALQVGQARGVILLALALAELPIAEYAPQRVKQELTDNRLATKAEVEAAVRILLHLRKPLWPDDAADAAAIAICHHLQMQREWSAGSSPRPAVGRKRRR